VDNSVSNEESGSRSPLPIWLLNHNQCHITQWKKKDRGAVVTVVVYSFLVFRLFAKPTSSNKVKNRLLLMRGRGSIPHGLNTYSEDANKRKVVFS
jgi:hypothetical protein